METSVADRAISHSAEDRAMSDVEYAYLLGAPPLRDFREFVRARCPEIRPEDESQLIDSWRAAVQRIDEIATAECGRVSDPDIQDLPSHMRSRADALLADPAIRASQGPIFCRWAMVNLDQLVMHQRSVDLGHVASLRSRLQCPLTDSELFAIAAGELQSRPEIGVVRNANTLTFSSVSSDLRYLGTEIRLPDKDGNRAGPGRPARIVALYVGYGINVLSALRVERRLILINGTHRCHALYGMGVREVPCLVREVACDEDLELIDAPELKQNLPIYLRSPRPPRLRDFFDPLLRIVIRAPPVTRLVHVQITTQESKAVRVSRLGEHG